MVKYINRNIWTIIDTRSYMNAMVYCLSFLLLLLLQQRLFWFQFFNATFCFESILNEFKLEAQHWVEPVSLILHFALKKLNTEHSIAYRCFRQASTLTFFFTCPFGQLTKTSCKSKSFGLVLYSAKTKFQ
jgi:hypothetical protein